MMAAMTQQAPMPSAPRHPEPPADEKVMLMLGAANRDPRRGQQPTSGA